MKTHVAFVKGTHNGEVFKCVAEFGFNPPMCVTAAPKIRDIFLNKGLEKCLKIADHYGFEMTVCLSYWNTGPNDPELESRLREHNLKQPGWKGTREMRAEIEAENMAIKEIIGDITKAEVDAIVNAANKTLLGGGGVDGAIHRAAGESLLMECTTIESIKGVRCQTGEAKITGAGKLNARFIIHTVGPIYDESLNPEAELASCYTSCLELALSNNCKSIAFPAISTGVYGFPAGRAKEIALSVCEKYRHKISIYLYFL